MSKPLLILSLVSVPVLIAHATSLNIAADANRLSGITTVDSRHGHPNHLIFEKGQEVAQQQNEGNKDSGARGVDPSGYWTDLFVPPYADCPTVITSISCLNQTRCFVSAGQDGTGFGVAEFDGSPSGQFRMMDMPNPPMMVMVAAVGSSGRDGIPRGVSGGMGFGNSLQYLSNRGRTWLPSALSADAPPFFPTQSIRASPDGQNILAVVEASMDPLPIVMYSSNAGQNFSTHRITIPRLTKTSGLRYAALASENVWYVTAGTWPRDDDKMGKEEKVGDDDHSYFTSPRARWSGMHEGKGTISSLFDSFALSETLAVARNTQSGAYEFKVRDLADIRRARADKSVASASVSFPPPQKKSKASTVNTQDGYVSQIFRTTDGGKTFTSVFENIGDFCLNGIDCFDTQTCYTVGSGVNGGVIYATRDGGLTWRLVYEVPATTDQHLTLFTITVSKEDGTIVAGGGWRGPTGFESFILSSTDGVSWARQKGPKGVREISSITLLPGGYGYATGITVMRAMTVLALRPNGSPTLPPQPTFSQVSCLDEKCSELCMAVAFPQKKCLAVTGGGSTVVHCDMARRELIQTYFPQSRTCEGNSTERTMPLNVCLKATSGGYFENVCSID